MRSTHVAIVAVSVLLAASSGLVAAQVTRGARAEVRTAADSAEVAALKPAFDTLLTADHDYQGHRVKAMREIAQACRLLGTDILPPDFEERVKERKAEGGAATKPATRPAKPEPEGQSNSDDQLTHAKGIVQQVLSSIPAGTQPKVVERLQNAVSELTTALSIK